MQASVAMLRTMKITVLKFISPAFEPEEVGGDAAGDEQADEEEPKRNVLPRSGPGYGGPGGCSGMGVAH